MRKAIIAGEIDLYPEYTGNAAFFFNEADRDTWKNAKKAYQRAAELDKQANDIIWLEPSPASNTWAIAVRPRTLRRGGRPEDHASDLARYIRDGGTIKLAASSEFVNSPAALPAFRKAYNFNLSADQLVTLSGGDTAATIAAAARQTSGVNAAMAYGTDGGIAASGLVVMADDKGVQPVYQPAPIVRGPVLEKYPEDR